MAQRIDEIPDIGNGGLDLDPEAISVFEKPPAPIKPPLCASTISPARVPTTNACHASRCRAM